MTILEMIRVIQKERKEKAEANEACQREHFLARVEAFRPVLGAIREVAHLIPPGFQVCLYEDPSTYLKVDDFTCECKWVDGNPGWPIFLYGNKKTNGFSLTPEQAISAMVEYLSTVIEPEGE